MNPVLDLSHIYSNTGVNVSLHRLMAGMENLETEYPETVNTLRKTFRESRTNQNETSSVKRDQQSAESRYELALSKLLVQQQKMKPNHMKHTAIPVMHH